MTSDVFNPVPPLSGLVASICKCSSPQEHANRAVASAAEDARYTQVRLQKEQADLAARTPKPDEYVIERVERIGDHLAMQVRYPSCKDCTYEGLKTMVFLDVSEVSALRWRRIDPHFRGKTAALTEAPSPAARFPGSADGWSDAVSYARGKVR